MLAKGIQLTLLMGPVIPFPAPRAVVIGSSHDGRGTNALLLRPPDVIAPAFGPPSVGRHVQLGLAAGAHTVIRPDGKKDKKERKD